LSQLTTEGVTFFEKGSKIAKVASHYFGDFLKIAAQCLRPGGNLRLECPSRACRHRWEPGKSVEHGRPTRQRGQSPDVMPRYPYTTQDAGRWCRAGEIFKGGKVVPQATHRFLGRMVVGNVDGGLDAGRNRRKTLGGN